MKAVATVSNVGVDLEVGISLPPGTELVKKSDAEGILVDFVKLQESHASQARIIQDMIVGLERLTSNARFQFLASQPQKDPKMDEGGDSVA